MAEFASNGKGNAALTTGIIGTSIGGLLALGSGLLNGNGFAMRNGYGCCFGICPLPTLDENALARGNTLEEAITNCIENDFVSKLGIKSLEVDDKR